MHKIRIDNQTLFARDGELLSSVLMRYGIAFPHPCGGRGVCKKCSLLVDGVQQLSCRYTVKHDISISFCQDNYYQNNEENDKITGGVCLAFDLGTTTLALAAVDKRTQKILRVVSRNNPQSVYGADIMTRIDYASRSSENALALHKTIIRALNEMITQLNADANELFVAGNTTMLHFFFGIDCTSIGAYPYTPKFLDSKTVKASDYGIVGVKQVTSLLNFHSFVGADLTAGAFLLPPSSDKSKYNILVDLGTNAEILLYNEDEVLCTAAAAGPCFEGANISCGMSYTSGAIHAFTIDENGNKIFKTAGDVPPRGVCGTGLIDLISTLVKEGIIDETGYMEDDYEVTDGVTLTGDDIRQFQLAKSAILSAILSLIDQKGISENEFLEYGVHGLQHGYYENGKQIQERFLYPFQRQDENGKWIVEPLPLDEFDRLLELYFAIYNDWGFKKPVPFFTSGNGAYGVPSDENNRAFARILKKYGIKVFQWGGWPNRVEVQEGVAFTGSVHFIKTWNGFDLDPDLLPDCFMTKDGYRPRPNPSGHLTNFIQFPFPHPCLG